MEDDGADKEYGGGHKQSKESNQLRIKLTSLGRTCDRFRISDRAGATVASAALQDFGVITTQEKSKVVDKSKRRRQRKIVRESLKETWKEVKIKVLYFDGQKDDTKVNMKKANRYYNINVKEEHITLIAEPDSKYLGHFAPSNGSASHIAEGIIDYIKREGASTDALIAIGCDGTVTNVGRKNGVIKLLEVPFGMPFH